MNWEGTLTIAYGTLRVLQVSSVIGSGLGPSIFVEVLIVQLVRALVWLGGWCHAWGTRFNPRPGRCTAHCGLSASVFRCRPRSLYNI